MGAEKERLAAEYLSDRGMQITARNFYCRQGEIDIIGRHEGYLVFVEVKYRSTEKAGNALEAVGFYKQKRICRAADYYRYTHPKEGLLPVRYDVVALQGQQVYWVRNAFSHIYR